jgi:glycosidase
MFPPSVPAATYRLQFNRTFTFDDATNIVEYLDRLGISHGYASSYFKAVPGSMHGYDVADPTQLNPEIGDRGTYNRWIETLRQHAMGHIADLVPNHMGIAKSANPWWQDVLENGPARNTRPFSTSTGIRSSRNSKTRCCCHPGDSYGACSNVSRSPCNMSPEPSAPATSTPCCRLRRDLRPHPRH